MPPTNVFAQRRRRRRRPHVCAVVAFVALATAAFCRGRLNTSVLAGAWSTRSARTFPGKPNMAGEAAREASSLSISNVSLERAQDFNVKQKLPMGNGAGRNPAPRHSNTGTAGNIGTNIKPYFFLHVGPPKTGTTSSQVEFTVRREELWRDGFEYVGFPMWPNGTWERYRPMGSIFTDNNCHWYTSVARKNESLDSSNNTPECWTRLKHLIDRWRSDNPRMRGIIQSDEVFTRGRGDAVYWEGARDELFREWNLVILVTYRRLADWYISARRQFHLRFARHWQREQQRASIPPIFPGALNFAKCVHLAAKSEGKRPAREYLGAYSLLPYFTPMETVEYYQNKGLDVRVINFHRLPSLAVELMCGIVPGADEACRLAKTSDPIHMGGGETLIYQEIASAAALKGLLDTAKIGKIPTVAAIKQRHEVELNMTASDFPMICPERKMLEEFLNISMEMEAKMLPTFHASPDGERMHQAQFWMNVERKKYCTVDIDAVLKDSGWRGFLLKHSGLSAPISSRQRY